MYQPYLQPVPDEDKYVCIFKYTYHYNNESTVVIPAGFIFDGASIPAIVWMFMYTPFHPKIMLAALVHDYLYSTGELPRRLADKIFFTLLLDNGVPEFKADLMYKGVRVGGKPHFNKEN